MRSANYMRHDMPLSEMAMEWATAAILLAPFMIVAFTIDALTS